jgi:lysophospholipase L1-like esterase
MLLKCYSFMVLLLLSAPLAGATAEDLLKDLNGDGSVYFLGFGDSITWGVGDGTMPGGYISSAPDGDGAGGYVARLGTALGIPVRNAGIAGERLVDQGEHRFAGTMFATNADIIGIMEGTNDTFDGTDLGRYQRAYQRMLNVAVALGKQPVLLTVPQACCDHGHGRPRLSEISNTVRRLAAVNELPYADIERAWMTTCGGGPGCSLLCMPEGLHPNSKGYDVVAQTLAATLLEIDIFAADGAAKLESALGWAPGTVVVKAAE